ncbi:nucleotide-diphospho-sugar transferase [Sarocladium strictum]
MWRYLSRHDYVRLNPTGDSRKCSWAPSPKLIRLLILAISTVLLLGFVAKTQDFKAVTSSKQEDKKKTEVKYKRPEYLPAKVDKKKEKYAYCAFLSKTLPTGDEKWDTEDYFVAMRTLVWQLKHDPETKADPDIDVVIMVGPGVSAGHQQRLRKDGAIVKPVELVHGQNDSWITPQTSRWADVMTKLRAWEMEEYSKVLILDGDILLAKPLDGVFTDPGAQLMETKPKGHKDDEPELPKDYLLSAIIDYNPNVPHNWPPTDAGRRRGHFNAGFFMLRPDKKLFNYFVGLLDVVDRFNPKFPEQNMLNYAFRWDGPMPFKEVSAVWNTNFANEDDLKAGTASVHMKFWKVDDKPMLKFAMSKRWQMEGYYLGRGDA